MQTLLVLGSMSLCGSFTSALSLQAYPSVAVNISSLFNNQAASANGTVGDFDGYGSTYITDGLPTGSWVYDGITFDLPSKWGSGNDNVLADGQIIDLPEPTMIHEIHFFYAADGNGGTTTVNLNFTFSDGTTQTLPLSAKDWWAISNARKEAVVQPYHWIDGNGSSNWNSTEMFEWSTSLAYPEPLVSIALPNTTTSSSRFHLFALSISPSSNTTNATEPELSVRRVQFSTRWKAVNNSSNSTSARAQAVSVAIDNLLPVTAFSANTSVTMPITVELTGSGLTTVEAGVINRLIASDEARVDVYVAGAPTGGNATVQLKDAQGNILATSDGWPVTGLPGNYTADATSLSQHETPTWWNEAKYGIFIHWGVYSVPAWAPSGVYAEWYDYSLHDPPLNSSNPTWEHHLETYGPSVVYDDFFSNFTASQFNASAWVDLFDRAGAKYFVLVTKHHDGFTLFEPDNTTHRSALYYGPKRDLVQELLSTAKAEKPDLHRGTYYSLPEWFNPYYAKYGFSSWPGGLAHNAFNQSELEPYTGILNISDYLEDLQLPHMLKLAETYDTEIMWCDIGGPNMTIDFAAAYFNHASAQGRQVVINDRCGDVPDFDTPEYALFASTQTRSWETNEGMDPFSYGLNAATNASAYKNGTTIIQTLVDVVSKNGNYLLDIGPTADGTIIDAMSSNLLDAGSWLAHSGDCVYATDYWFRGAQDTTGTFRYLTTPTTFCIVSFAEPQNGQLVVNETVPILPGDTIQLLGSNASTGVNGSLPWSFEDGRLMVNVSQSAVESVQYAWAFQITYKQE